jgi:hypothetical protein
VDVRGLRGGELLTGASAVGLLAVLFADWFGGRTAFATLRVTLVVLLALVVLALTVVALTLTSVSVAMACSAAAVTVGVAVLAALFVLYRLVLDEPGPNAAVDVGLGAYLGLAFVVGCGAGAWRALADERTQTPASLRQTERVLAVRGAPRPPPPARSSQRGERG